MHRLAPIVAAVALAGCGKPTVSDVSKTEPAFKLTAAEFFVQAKAEKFKGKVIELTGTVGDVSRNASGEAFVELQVARQMLGVMCFTADQQPWGKVARGQKVRIKGEWADVVLAPRLLSCVFVETGEYAAVRTSATDLAREFATDPEATSKKYNKKNLVVTGQVVSKEANKFQAVAIVLKTENDVTIQCGFAGFDDDLTGPIEVGRTVTVFGEFSSGSGGKTVELNSCLPLSEK